MTKAIALPQQTASPREALDTVSELVSYLEAVVLEGAIDTIEVAASMRLLPDEPETRTAAELETAHAGIRNPAIVADIINTLRAVLETASAVER